MVINVLVAGARSAELAVRGPARLGTPLPRPPHRADAVILLPGFANGASMLDVMKRSLEADGFRAFVFDDPNHGLGDYRLAADRFDAFALDVQRQTGARKVDLVAYSAGVTVARTWLARHADAAARTDSFVDLDGSWRGDDDHRFLDMIKRIPGVANHLWNALPPAELHLQQGSDLFTELARHPELPTGVRVTSIVAGGTVNATDYVPGATNIELPDSPSHLAMVRTSNSSYEAVRGALLTRG
ncbi:MAG: hypothetical protein H7123_00850 [Thermoleophilia bacterium]|nr:hypothetical protein [Thermoleophilia bacterium]